MTKKFLILPLLLALAVMLSACGQPSPAGNKATDKSVEKVQDLINKVDQGTQGIVVPANLIKDCPAKYWEEKNKDGTLKGCETYGSVPACSYYKEIKNGQEKIKLLEYKNECYACRTYGQTGQTNMGTTVLISIGWENSPCSQGMYKGK